MISWESQKELVRTLWVNQDVRTQLKDVLKPSHFERPDLGWVVKTLYETQGDLTTAGLLDKINLSSANPNILDACGSLVPDVEKSEIMSFSQAVETGREFAFCQEAVIFAGQLVTLARNKAYGEIRNRTEDMLKLSGSLAVEDVDGMAVTRAADVVSESVSWLWPGFIPFKKVSTIEGNGGLGKSVLTLDLAARLSRGLAPPFYTGALVGEAQPYEASDVIVLSVEDGFTDTIRPRLEVAGADLDRVHLVSGVYEKVKSREGTETVERSVALDRDVMRLENLIVKTKARLVIIDPIVAMLGGADFHREQDVRRVLKSLAKVAERRDCAVVTIRHLNKNNSGEILARGSGSIGFVSAVRTAMLVVKHPTSEEDRVIAVYKTNLSRPPQPAIFRLEAPEGSEVPRVVWGQRSGRTIAELLESGDKT